MKTKLFILFLFFAFTSIGQNVFFVALDGNDSNAGTIAAPWATVMHGVQQLFPGDTLYIRGGTYSQTVSVSTKGYFPSRTGTAENPIVVSRYQNEEVIFDGSFLSHDPPLSLFGVGHVHYWKFFGFTIQDNYPDAEEPIKIDGFSMSNTKHVTLEQLVSRRNHGGGFNVQDSDSIYFINCDAYDNFTTYGPPGSQSDTPGASSTGFRFIGSENNDLITLNAEVTTGDVSLTTLPLTQKIDAGTLLHFVVTIEPYWYKEWTEELHVYLTENASVGDTNLAIEPAVNSISSGATAEGYFKFPTSFFEGCRAWNNGNNGFSCASFASQTRVNNCWSFYGGWGGESSGRGFSFGLEVPPHAPDEQVIITNSISAINKGHGFHLNARSGDASPNTRWYNNLVIHQGSDVGPDWPYDRGWGFVLGYTSGHEDPYEAPAVIRNNVVYNVTLPFHQNLPADYLTVDHNTWQMNSDPNNPEVLTVTEADFVGPVDSLSLITAMMAPRKADGSLPDLPNLMPSSGSQLRDAGVDVGLPYYGTAPDLGPFQYDPGVTGHILIFQIENETGNAINNASITFNGATRPPGIYTLPGIEEGTYDFSVAAPGYENYVYNGLLVEEDMEISVVMTALPTYNLTFDVKDSNDNPISNGVVTLGDITNPLGNYSFTGIPEGTYNYSVTATGYQTIDVTGYEVNADATIEVVMSSNIYTIALNASPSQGGTVSGHGTYTHGQTVNVSASPNEGYSFVNWTENGNVVSTQAEYSFTATQNRDLTAHFLIHTYTVSLTADPTGGGNLTGSGTYDHNASVTVNAQANTGHTFVNWTENGNEVSTNPQFSFNITSNRSFIANFSVNTYEIQASASPADGGSVSGAGTYTYGQTATLTATPADEYNFTYWRENGNVVSNQPEYSFTVNGNRNLTAHFALDVYSVALESNPPDAGILNGAGNYSPGDNVTIYAEPNPGFVFENWTDGDLVVSQDPQFSFEITGDRNFTANFSNEIHTLTLNPNPTFGGITTGAGSYTHGENVTAGALPNPGFHFVSWTQNGLTVSEDAFYSFSIMQDRDLEAQFAPNEYLIQVQISPDEGGMVTGAGWYEHGDAVTLVASPAQDYVFLQWLDTGLEVSQSPDLTFIANKDRNLEAVFVHVDELVRIDAQSFPAGYAFIEGAGDYPVNRRVRLNAEPVTSDYSFVGWMENGRYIGHENPFLFNAAEDRNITASFTYEPGEVEVNAQLSIPETGHIYGTGNYSRGQIAILQAELHEDVSFLGWKNQAGQIVSRQNPFNFEVNRNMDMMAMVEMKDGMLDDDSQLKVYPNPSDGRFTLTIREEAIITVHNSQGIALETIRVTPEENQVNLGYLPSGVYFLRFQTQTEVLSRKIIIR